MWEIGLRKWAEKRSTIDAPEKRPGVTINRRDLIAVPVPDANHLWKQTGSVWSGSEGQQRFFGAGFSKYFEKLGTRNLMLKTDYHALAHLVPRELIDPEIVEKLNRIVEVANQAKPVP